jgi:hypothetical protein
MATANLSEDPSSKSGAIRRAVANQRAKYASYLVFEVLGDDLVHFEASAIESGSSASEPLYSSPMILRDDYAGPSRFTRAGNVLETRDVRLTVDAATLCVAAVDQTKVDAGLTRFCPRELEQALKRLEIDRGRGSRDQTSGANAPCTGGEPGLPRRPSIQSRLPTLAPGVRPAFACSSSSSAFIRRRGTSASGIDLVLRAFYA